MWVSTPKRAGSSTTCTIGRTSPRRGCTACLRCSGSISRIRATCAPRSRADRCGSPWRWIQITGFASSRRTSCSTCLLRGCSDRAPITMNRSRYPFYAVRPMLLAPVVVIGLLLAAGAAAQSTDAAAPAAAPAKPAATGPLAPLAWLPGCWRGEVNHREFREYWMPPQGDIMVGVGQLALDGKMNDYEYLRLQSTDGAIVFSQFSGDRKELAFKLATTTTDDKDTVFTFANTAAGFPARLIYRRSAVDGWLYETVEGSLNGADKQVIYPLRRINCETGSPILH